MNNAIRIDILVQNAQARKAIKAVEADFLRFRKSTQFAELTRVGNTFRDFGRQAGALGGILKGTGAEGVRALTRIRLAARLGAVSLQTLGNAVTAMGRNMQWLGRQIEFRISLPLAILSGFAIKFALDNERAFTRIRKVYGGAADAIGEFDDDLGRLRIAFRNLSDVFGVNQHEVLEVAASWAQAGAQGVFLAEAVRLTIQTAILGEIELGEATRGLLVIQQAYQLNIEELTAAIAVLNQVENETTATLPDLIEVFQDAAGAATITGTTFQDLAALTAALIPVAGDASEVGNALKTIMFRIVAPTNQAAAAFAKIGVDINSVEFASAGLVDKLFQLSRGYDELGTAQQAQFVRDVFQLRQGARASILIQDLLARYSRFASAKEAVADATANENKFNDELMAFLESSPQQIAIVTTRMKNLLAELGVQLLPVFTTVLKTLESLMRGFNGLDSGTKRWIITILAVVAVIGPLLGLMGALQILIGLQAKNIGFLALQFMNLSKAMFVVSRAALVMLAPFALIAIKIGLIVLAVAAVAEIIARIFGTSLPEIFNNFVAWLRGFNLSISKVWEDIKVGFFDLIGAIAAGLAMLPNIFATAINAVISFLSQAVMVIFDLLSYLNPFAKHSPSLVSQVKDGIDAIIGHYERATVIVDLFKRAADNLQSFVRASQAARDSLKAGELAEQREIIQEQAPEAVGAFDVLTKDLVAMNSELIKLDIAIRTQQQVADGWKNALAGANRELDLATDLLRDLRDEATDLEQALADSQNAIATLGSTPITGMGAAQDDMAATTLEMKKLKLEILQLKKAEGAIEDTEDALARLSGELELLRDRRSDLRLAGAGGDILGVLDGRIGELETARDALMDLGGTGSGQALKDLEDDLAALGLENEIAQLEFDIEFGPQLAAIQDLIDLTEEMDFEDIIDAIGREQQASSDLAADLALVNEEIEKQQLVVDDLTAARDAALERYDQELAKLGAMKDAYRALKDLINDAEAAINDFVRAAETGGSGAGDDFGPDVDIPDVKGSGAAFGAAGFSQDDLDQFIADNLQFDTIIPLNIKDKLDKVLSVWRGFQAGLDATFKAIGTSIDFLTSLWGSHVMPTFDRFALWVEANWEETWFTIRDAIMVGWNATMGFLVPAWQIMSEVAQEVWARLVTIWGGIVSLWHSSIATLITVAGWLNRSLDPIREELALWGPMLGEMWAAVQKLPGLFWTGIQGMVGAFVWLVGQVQTHADTIKAVLGVVFGAAVTIAAGLWLIMVDGITRSLRIIRSIWDVFAGLFTGDWKRVWEGIKTILLNLFPFGEEIFGAIVDAWNTTVQAIKDGVNAVIDFFRPMATFIADVASTIWTALLPVRLELAKWGPQLNDMWNVAKIVFKGLVALLIAPALAFKLFVESLINQGPAIWSALKTVFGFFEWWADRVWDIMQLGFRAIKWFVDQLTTQGTTINRVWGLVVSAFKAAWTFIVNFLAVQLQLLRGTWEFFAGLFTGDWDRMWGGVKIIFEAVWKGFLTTLQLAWDAMKLIGDAIIIWFQASWNAQWWVIKAAFGLVWDAIVAVLDVAWVGLKNLGNQILSWFKLQWDIAWWLISAAFGLVWGAITAVVETAWTGIQNAAGSIMGVFGPVWDAFWTGVKILFESAWSLIGAAVTGAKIVITTAKDAIVALFNFVNWGQGWENLKANFGTVWTGISGAVDTALGVIETALTGAKGALSRAWDAIEGVFAGAASGIMAVLQPILDGIQAITGWKIPSWVPGIGSDSLDFDKIGDFIGGVVGSNQPPPPVGNDHNFSAAGRITDGPTIAGEGRRAFPEFIIPTDPKYSTRAQALLALANARLGGGGNGGRILTSTAGNSGRQVTFTGDLVFPNISDGKDARSFIENLSSLIDDTTT